MKISSSFLVLLPILSLFDRPRLTLASRIRGYGNTRTASFFGNDKNNSTTRFELERRGGEAAARKLSDSDDDECGSDDSDDAQKCAVNEDCCASLLCQHDDNAFALGRCVQCLALGSSSAAPCSSDRDCCEPGRCFQGSCVDYCLLFGEGGCSSAQGPDGGCCGDMECVDDVCSTNDCENSPCQNGGICANGVGDSYSCTCEIGFEGINCENNIDDCTPNPCQNGGSCNNGVNSFTCNCAAGFDGDKCEIDIDECASIPCKNGGSCVNTVGSFTCNCANGYEGLTCEVDIDDCANNPCQNGGTCVDGVDSYTCTNCETGYTGNDCGTDINECENDPCQNGAICMNTLGSFSCDCPEGFGGPNCEIDICENVVCLNNGSCVVDGVDSTCVCSPGFAGENCEINIDDCEGNPCNNGGTCVDGDNSYRCLCRPGFNGLDCESNISDCDPNPCQNGGTCVDGDNSYDCTCADGFVGHNCEIDICANAVCLNGGICIIDGGDSFTCNCAEGFVGDNCEINIDDCASNPCDNGGVCVDGDNSYHCVCLPGFTGDTCKTNVDDCDPNPCQNGGTCSDGVNSYHCACMAGYSGDTCEIDIDDCTPSPCQNGGSCRDRVNSFQCDCAEGFIGDNCESCVAGKSCTTDRDCCEPDICFGGTCQSCVRYGQPCTNDCCDGLECVTTDGNSNSICVPIAAETPDCVTEEPTPAPITASPVSVPTATPAPASVPTTTPAPVSVPTTTPAPVIPTAFCQAASGTASGIIDECNTVLSEAAGTFFLKEDLICDDSSANGITFTGSTGDIAINCNGHAIRLVGDGSGSGIDIDNKVRGKVTISNCIFRGWENGIATTNKEIEITNVVVSGNRINGIWVRKAETAVITNVLSRGNGRDGNDGQGIMVDQNSNTVIDGFFSNDDFDGILVYASFSTTIRKAGVRNSVRGVVVRGASGTVIMDVVVVRYQESDGIRIEVAESVSMNRVSASNNRYGLEIFAGVKAVSITDSSFDDNTDAGIAATFESLTVVGITCAGNGKEGLIVQGPASGTIARATIENSFFMRNGSQGISTDRAFAQIDNVVTGENTQDGILLKAARGGSSLPSMVTGVISTNNGRHGFHVIDSFVHFERTTSIGSGNHGLYVESNNKSGRVTTMKDSTVASNDQGGIVVVEKFLSTTNEFLLVGLVLENVSASRNKGRNIALEEIDTTASPSENRFVFSGVRACSAEDLQGMTGGSRDIVFATNGVATLRTTSTDVSCGSAVDTNNLDLFSRVCDCDCSGIASTV